MDVIILIVNIHLIPLVCDMNTKSELSLFAMDNLEVLFRSFTILMIDVNVSSVSFSKAHMYRLYEMSNKFIDFYKSHYSEFV